MRLADAAVVLNSAEEHGREIDTSFRARDANPDPADFPEEHHSPVGPAPIEGVVDSPDGLAQAIHVLAHTHDLRQYAPASIAHASNELAVVKDAAFGGHAPTVPEGDPGEPPVPTKHS
jgi:hypothetical protein